MTVRHGIAWLSLLIGSVVGVPQPRRPTTPRQASRRMRARRFAHTKRTRAYPPSPGNTG